MGDLFALILRILHSFSLPALFPGLSTYLSGLAPPLFFALPLTVLEVVAMVALARGGLHEATTRDRLIRLPSTACTAATSTMRRRQYDFPTCA